MVQKSLEHNGSEKEGFLFKHLRADNTIDWSNKIEQLELLLEFYELNYAFSRRKFYRKYKHNETVKNALLSENII